jgi:hypothetical protein
MTPAGLRAVGALHELAERSTRPSALEEERRGATGAWASSICSATSSMIISPTPLTVTRGELTRPRPARE